jgi:cytoskeletal protein RodZ
MLRKRIVKLDCVFEGNNAFRVCGSHISTLSFTILYRMETTKPTQNGTTEAKPSSDSAAVPASSPPTANATSDASKTANADSDSRVPTNGQDGQEPSKPSANQSSPPSLSASLRSQIEALSAVQARMTTLRSIPWRMLRLQTQSSHSSLLGVGGGVPQLAGSGSAVGMRLTSSGSAIAPGSQGAVRN